MIEINKNSAWFRKGARCKYSNLSVSRPIYFVGKGPGDKYFLEMAKLGDRILLVKVSGYASSSAMAESIRFTDKYISRFFSVKKDIIVLEDYANVEGADTEARKQYIAYFKDSGIFSAGIFYNFSPLFRISFMISKTLHIYDNYAHAVTTYPRAIDLALKLSRQKEPGPLCHDAPALPKNPVKKFNHRGFWGILEHVGKQAGNAIKLSVFSMTDKLSGFPVKQYSDELIKHIESIDWQKTGSLPENRYLFDHTDYRNAFEAISFIKSEIDTLMQQRDGAEKILRESESRHRQLVEHANAGILEFDFGTGKVISANDSLLSITGFTREEILTMDPMHLLAHESKKQIATLISRLRSGKSPVPGFACRIKTKTEATRWILLNANIIRQEQKPQKVNIILTDITQLKNAEQKLLAYQEKLKQLTVQLSMSEENQRRHLASQLHDGVTQELFVTHLRLNQLKKSFSDPDHIEEIVQIQQDLLKTIKETRSVTFDLSPPVLYDLGLQEAIVSMAKEIELKHRLKVKTYFSENLDDINEKTKIIFYRNIKELIHNAVKHAKASTIDIKIQNINGFLQIEIKDDGVGFDAADSERHNGFGLFDMKEKIDHLGGRLIIDSEPGSGTRIGITVTSDRYAKNLACN